MDPNSQTFLIANGVVIAMVVIYMLFVRPRIKKAGLRISAPPGEKVKLVEEPKDEEPYEPQIPKADERPVNVIFTWNGHAWDAYEVLGLPAGASMEEVTKAYDEALKKVDAQSQEFIHKAYRSICDKVEQAS